MKTVRDSWVATHRPQLLIIATVAFIALVTVGAITAPAVALPTAFITLIVGIAAQQSLGNIFAGIVLALAHPFKVGDIIEVSSVGLIGVVRTMGIVYTELISDKQVLYIPNSSVLAGAVKIGVPDDIP